MTGTLYGVGVGPGDPELLTMKAVRILKETPVIAYPCNPEGESRARDVAAPWLSRKQREIPISMPFHRDRRLANQAYDETVAMVTDILRAGQDVAVLCEGDALFFGSFIYLQQRLARRFPCVVIPGVSAINGATAAAGLPLAAGNDRIAIVPATAGRDALRQALRDYDSIAIMKPGRHRPWILDLLLETGRADDAVYVEQATRQGQRIVTRMADLPVAPGPYFALFLVTRPVRETDHRD